MLPMKRLILYWKAIQLTTTTLLPNRGIALYGGRDEI